MPLPRVDPAPNELAAAFRTHRKPLAEGLFAAWREPDCGSGAVPSTLNAIDPGHQAYFSTAIDLAERWFATGDALWQDLFAGWVHSNLREPSLALANPDRYQPVHVLEHARVRWGSFLATAISTPALQILSENLGSLIARLMASTSKRLRVVYIGDCLIGDVMNGMVGQSLDLGIELDSVLVHDPVHAVLRNQIRALKGGVDLVFYSPFSHNFSPEYELLLRPWSAFWSRARMFGLLDRLLDEISNTLRTVAARMQCPIYVHNSGGTLLMDSLRLRRWGLYALSWRNRHDAVVFIDERLRRILADPALEGRVQLLDELRLQETTSRLVLGFSIFNGSLFHPSRLGLALARGPYRDAVWTAAYLIDKKVVVCDLDNTLWDGVIGEGPVRHHFDRQQLLLELRRRGILLSINSKNDPANVHFSGCALQADDFVAPRINWDSKVANMHGIVAELNLNPAHFIFIDDRPEELERMKNAFPGMLILDARETSTWRRLALWPAHLSASGHEDRTRLYHERAAREQFLAVRPTEPSQEDELTALKALDLSVTIETVGRSGVKRAVELINRTNQFNVAGSRTTQGEVESGLGASHTLLAASVRDKFGNMGVVGVMRVDLSEPHAEIPVFVLSCRVFGFGIEYALLNALRRLLPGDRQIIGHYRETQANGPGRQLYANSGFTWNGTHWTASVADLPPDPAWLRIEYTFASQLPEGQPINVA